MASRGSGFRYYQYDAWGNIKDFSALTLSYETNSYGAPATNRISGDGVGGSYSYDEAGNMMAGMGQTFAYDGANRMKTASNGSSTYGYDGDGMRVRKTESSATTYYVKSNVLKNVAMEVSSPGVLRAYVYTNGKLTAMQATDGQFYWLHTNHLGSSRAMTDVNGNLTYKGHFDPYGQTLSEWSASGNNNLNTKKFTGYERDGTTGLDYAGARMYNSTRGRFVTPDQSGLRSAKRSGPQTMNRYSYTYNDPVNHIDPTGLTPEVYYCHWIYVGEEKRLSCSPGPSGGSNDPDEETPDETNSGDGGGGGGDEYWPEPKWEDLLNKRLKNQGCNDFTSKALNGLGFVGTIIDVYHAITLDFTQAYSSGGGKVAGSFDPEGNIVTISPIPKIPYPFQAQIDADRAKAEYEYSTALIHELFHYGYGNSYTSHNQMVKSAYNSLSSEGKAKFEDDFNNLKEGEESNLFQKMLEYSCPPE